MVTKQSNWRKLFKYQHFQSAQITKSQVLLKVFEKYM